MIQISTLAALLLAVTEAQPQPPPQHIVGGTDCTTCEFPASVWIGSAGGFNCTASLVHPRVLITAAHCLGGISQAGFGETAWSPAMTVAVERCQGHSWYDLGYCVLAEDAPPVDMVPVIMGCEVDELTPGTPIYLAGFGQSDEASGSGGGTKRWTTNTVDYISYDAGSIYLNGDGTGSCYGDSGGPAYVQLSDGTWRVIAAVQGPHPNAPPLGCGHGGTYTLIHSEMDWIESGSGYDITPCFDADGTWNPDERCDGFPTQLQGFAGTWGALCEGSELSGPGATCGDPIYEPPPDHETTGGGETDGDSMGDGTGGADTDGDGGGTTGDPDEDEDADEDEDEDDADQNGSGTPPGYLPPRYGHDNIAPACRVAPSGQPAWLLLLLVLFARQRRSSGRVATMRDKGSPPDSGSRCTPRKPASRSHAQ